MNKKKIILVSIIFILISVISGAISFNKKKPDNQMTNENVQEPEQEMIEQENNEPPKEIIIEDENELPEEQEEIQTLKENLGKTGNSELYEVQDGYNNTKIVTIKSSVKYKVAFTGMLKNKTPIMSEIDNYLEQKHPKYAGIWVYEKDREDILDILKEITNSEYKIDENGYLKIINKNNQNDNDKKLESIIKGEKLYIIRISSICYIIDEVTGKILDYNFEKLDRYQTYEYFQDKDKMIIFMNENTKQQMTSKEIFQSIIDLM